MIQVLSSLEDEQMFSNLNFINSKIHIDWQITWIYLFVCMFGQSFLTMDKFLYDEATHIWQTIIFYMFWTLVLYLLFLLRVLLTFLLQLDIVL
jgi:hypothetical protein